MREIIEACADGAGAARSGATATEDRRPLRQLHGRGPGRGARPHADPAAARADRGHHRPGGAGPLPRRLRAPWRRRLLRVVRRHRRPPLRPLHRQRRCRAASGCPTSPTTARRSSPRSARSTSPTSPRILTLAERPDPEGTAGLVVALETRLAAGHWDRAETRDVIKTYNLTTLDELQGDAAELRLRRVDRRARRHASRRSPRPSSGSRRTSPTSRRCSPTPRSRTGTRS